MDFIHSDLGQRQRGDVVEITLSGNAANVRVLDSSNVSRYRLLSDTLVEHAGLPGRR